MNKNGSKDHQHSSVKKSSSSGDTLDKISSQTKGLFEDLTSWMELKIQFVILDYQEQLTKKAKGAAFEVASLAVLGVSVLFGLVALALGLGVLLGHAAWGFLIVMVLLVLVALVIRGIGKRIKSPDISGNRQHHGIDISEEKPKLTSPKIPATTGMENGKG